MQYVEIDKCQVVHISNEILNSVCQKYISLRNYDRNGVNATWNAVSDVLMWIKTKNRSLQWIQYHDYSDNTTDPGSKCAAIKLSPDGKLTVFDTHCNTELPYICLRCNNNISLFHCKKPPDKRKKCVKSAMDCMKDIHNLKNTTNQLKEDAYWIVIPRNEQFLSKERDAESTCIVTTYYNNIVSPVISDCCNTSYYMMCNDTDWTNKSPLLSSSYFCFTKECIIYISSSVAGIICITVFVVLVCNAYRNRKKVRMKKLANRTVEEIQLDEMPTASSYLYEEHFDADINQINQTESNEVNDGENEISGSKSRLKEDTIRPNKNTKEQAIAENEYNSLNHTLRKPGNAASNAVYDKVKPAIITLIRGEQFVGTEYDSVDVLKRNTNTHLAKL
ncbi:CSPG3 [Mytilus edulis]|uniref:NCAN n=1 Tax=Mytilus edulis TaxID=6550 RepID=A0A8S3VM21_MYTED|nr:CSPG3 [Mytilus edulis]